MTKLSSKSRLYINALVGAVLFVLWPGVASALSSDSDKPIEIVADEAEHDSNNDITIYRGNVEVTQGTMFLSGHTLRVYYDDEQELDHAIMEGDLAYYRQLPDNSKVHDEAWAKQMEYYPNDDMVILIDEGKVIQDDVRFTGDRIEYDTENSRVIAKTVRKAEEEQEKRPAGGDNRVRVIINPKKEADEGEE